MKVKLVREAVKDSGYRPCIYLEKSKTVIPLTSKARQSHGIFIRHWKEAKLVKPSWAVLKHAYVLDSRVTLGPTLGQLAQADREKLERILETQYSWIKL